MDKSFETIVNGKQRELQSGLTLAEIHESLFGTERRSMAAIVNGSLLELTQVIGKAREIEFIYPHQNEEASRMYLRGLVFLLLRAIRQTLGGAKLKTEYILSGGVYCTVEDKALTSVQIRMLEEKMKEYVLEGLPFIRRQMTTEEAMAYFKEHNEDDKVHLLEFRPFGYFNIYEYDGLKNYFYGIMPPDSSYLDVFFLKKFEKGFILNYPAPFRIGDKDSEEQPKLARVFADAEKWAHILEVSKVADLNELVKNKGLREFIMVNEALHEKKLSELANNICERNTARVVLIAGPSSSGKTTFANRLKIHLRVHGKHCHPISIDDFYRNKEDIPLDEHGKADLENITAIDTERFNQDILSLLAGRETVLPRFNFLKGKREDGKTLRLEENDLLIIEGIHGLNEQLSRDIEAQYKYKIFISPLCPLNLDNQNNVYPEDIRLLRRLIRDKLTRGYSFNDTLNIWESVRRGEYKYILPYMENADTMFNSALLYEAAILKKYAYDELNELKSQNIRANYLVKFLNYFVSCDEEADIPQNSILREFIGKSCFFD
jgi:uridine kinase